MQIISKEELYSLTAHELALRIDTFIAELVNSTPVGGANLEFKRNFIGITATSILASKVLQRSTEADKKRLLQFFFRSRFQTLAAHQLLFQLGQILSQGPVSSPFYTALGRQNITISSRIAFECLMEFVSIIKTGNLIKGKKNKSKLFAFREMLFDDQTFGWLILSLPLVYRFDRTHRTPEIHGTSSMALDALRADAMTSMTREPMLMNLMQNIWKGILASLNDEIVHIAFDTYPEDKTKVLGAINSWHTMNLRRYWDENWKDIN